MVRSVTPRAGSGGAAVVLQQSLQKMRNGEIDNAWKEADDRRSGP